MSDGITYVLLGLSVCLFIGLVILFVLVFNLSSTLNKKITEMSDTFKSDLTNSTSDLRNHTTILHHKEFEKLNPKIKELLLINVSYGFIPNLMTALSTYITRNNLLPVITAAVEKLNSLSQEELLATMNVLHPITPVVEQFTQKTSVIEGFTNYFRNFFK